MKEIKTNILQNKYFLLFVVLFAYAQTIHTRLVVWGKLNLYSFTPEAAIITLIEVYILYLIIVFFIKRWHSSNIFSIKEMIKIFVVSLVVYLVIIQMIGFLVSFLFNNIERNFNWDTVILSTFSYFLNGFIYGSFFLGYYYYHENKKHQDQLAIYNLALSESRIKQLKTQLNPHFLFNNLNVLDQLIEEDKNKASNFLNEFAEIYRYVLQATEKEVVPIKEEIKFADLYFKLIKHKYGKAYQLAVSMKSEEGFIVPLTLQLLIENAIKHNLGTEKQPVLITIIGDNYLTISNNVLPKNNIGSPSGRGLDNLREQYSLLTDYKIEIKPSIDTFRVMVPIIHMKEML